MGTARYAASACCWPAVQCQGRSSCSRICSISAMRARTPASQTWGSMSLSLALPIRDYNTAALVAAAIGASEQPGFASETDAAQRSLRSIVREANAAVMLSTPAQTRVKHCHSNELAHLLRPGTCIVVPPHSKTLIANSRNRSVSPFHRELVRQLSIAAAGRNRRPVEGKVIHIFSVARRVMPINQCRLDPFAIQGPDPCLTNAQLFASPKLFYPHVSALLWLFRYTPSDVTCLTNVQQPSYGYSILIRIIPTCVNAINSRYGRQSLPVLL